MTLDEFKEAYNMAPFDLEEFAEEALKVTDDDQLVDMANRFLGSQARFINALKERGVELG